MAATSLCSIMKAPRVQSDQSNGTARPNSQGDNDDVICSSVGLRGDCNNLALGTVHFRHIESQLMNGVPSTPKVGDVCVRFLPVTPSHGRHCGIVDLYNTNVAEPSSVMAKKVILGYVGTEELYIPSMPIHLLVSEWNKSLDRFHGMIRCDDSCRTAPSLDAHRDTVMRNVLNMAYKNVPVASEHLWFAIHCIVAKPHLVKEVLQLVGSIGSVLGDMCHTGDVQATTVPRPKDCPSAMKLYLVAKPCSSRVSVLLEDCAGVTLSLVWAVDEDELLCDYLRNSGKCYYVHIGTEHANTFRCNGSCVWRYSDHDTFQRMIAVAETAVALYKHSELSGNTADSARLLTTAC